MAWETRPSGRYYYRARRVGGRVVKEYVGKGPLAEAAAELDEAVRRERTHLRAEEAAQRAARERVDGSLEAFGESLDEAVAVALGAAGFHRHHRGEWRRKRERRT